MLRLPSVGPCSGSPVDGGRPCTRQDRTWSRQPRVGAAAGRTDAESLDHVRLGQPRWRPHRRGARGRADTAWTLARWQRPEDPAPLLAGKTPLASDGCFLIRRQVGGEVRTASFCRSCCARCRAAPARPASWSATPTSTTQVPRAIASPPAGCGCRWCARPTWGAAVRNGRGRRSNRPSGRAYPSVAPAARTPSSRPPRQAS